MHPVRYTQGVAPRAGDALKSMKFSQCFRLFTMALLLPASLALAKPDFSGQWKLDPAQSDFGALPAPTSMERSVEHKDPKLSFKSVQTGPRGEARIELTLTTDGKPFTGKSQFGEIRGKARWEGDVLVIETTRSVQGGEIAQTDRWQLSADGKSMTVHTTIALPQGGAEIKTTFDKQ